MGSFTPVWDEVQPENKWKILGVQKRFAFWALYTSIGSMMLGFDFGIAGTATAFPAFQKQFGIPFPSQPSGYLVPANYQAGWNGASAAGDILGVMIAGPVMEWVGRKHTLIIGTLLTSVGVIMQVVSHEWKLFLVARFINAVGFGAVFLVSPVWIGETVRPELRGFFLCLMNGSIVLGQFILSVVAKGTSTMDGKYSYQILILLQFAFVAPLILGYPFFPESPYYLLKHGKDENARKSLNRIHGSGDQVLIDVEMKRIQATVDFSEQMKKIAGQKGPLPLQCFQKTNRKRTLIGMLPAAGQQLIGAAFVLGYITYFLSLIGVTQFFTVGVVLYIVMLLSNGAAFVLIETTGRRALLVPGIIALTCILLLMDIMGCVKSGAALWVIVVCVFLWAIAYQLTIGAVGFALGGEIASLPLRPATQSIIGITSGGVGWLIGFISPYMINPDAGNLGAKVGFVFAGLGIFLCVLFYFYIPETQGLSFTEIDYLFKNKISSRHFQTMIKEERARGLILEVDKEGGALKKEVDLKGMEENATFSQVEASSSNSV